MRTERWVKLLGTMLTGLFLPVSAHAAAYVSPLVGGSGGSAYTVSCGAGGVLVGMQVKYGFWIDQLTPVCRRFLSDGSLGSDFTLARIGGSGGNNVGEIRCGSQQVVAGLIVRWGTYIDSVGLQCADWLPTKKIRSETVKPVAAIGGSGGAVSTLRCPAGQVGKALKGKAGGYVDSLSLVCNLWNQQ